MRSRTFLYVAYTCPYVAILFTFLYVPLYVPIRSGRPLHFPASGGTDKAHTLRKYSLRGSNPRPMAHKTIALTTELREPLLAQARRSAPLAVRAVIRSYTFCYTFLYVPGGLCTFLSRVASGSCGHP